MKLKHKVKVVDTRPYQFHRELTAIIDSMARAMQDAHPPYIADGGITPSMELALAQFQEWAIRYVRNQR